MIKPVAVLCFGPLAGGCAGPKARIARDLHPSRCHVLSAKALASVTAPTSRVQYPELPTVFKQGICLKSYRGSNSDLGCIP